MYPLRPLPGKELVSFLVDRFKEGGKSCPIRVAEKISEKVSQYPYYAQALAYNIFEISEDIVSEDDIHTGFNNMMASERYGYEAVVQGLTGPQISLLKALAIDPVSKILSTEYMNRHRLSAGGIQYARNKLEKLDLIEKHNNVWKIVDPVFGCWLAGYWYGQEIELNPARLNFIVPMQKNQQLLFLSHEFLDFVMIAYKKKGDVVG